MLVILFVATETRGCHDYLFPERRVVALDTSEFAVLAFQFEMGFVVIEIPIFPITGVVAILTACPQGAFMNILFFMARPAI